MENTIVAFTAHRNYDNPMWVWNSLYSVVGDHILRGYTGFISGACYGGDIVAAEAVIDQLPDGIELILAIPYPGFGSSWEQVWINRLQNIKVRANRIETISDSWKGNDTFFARDRWMVDNAQALISLWDGRRKGGTFYTTRYAQDKGYPITWINPKTKTVGQL